MATPQKGEPPPKYLIFEDFSGGMNTQSARQNLRDNEAAWLENLQPLASNKLLAVQSPVDALAMLTGETVVYLYGAEINSQDYLVAFCQSGAGYAISVTGGPGIVATGGVVTKFAPGGTFAATGADMTVWNGERLLFADTKAGYSTWDGNVFVSQGGVSPNLVITAAGSGYNLGATAAITGGTGSGATASVQVSGDAVIGLTLTNPGTGYLAGDTLTVIISPIGGGSGATANAHVWPFVSPMPTTLAIGFGRVWLANGRTLIATGTGSVSVGEGYDDFAAGDASVTTTISDADLVRAVTALRFLNGFLYIIGDNSVKFIGSIAVSGSTTNFTITPLSSDQGTTFLNSVLSYNRLVIFANTVGVYAVFGASVQKISDPMDAIFQLTDFILPIQCAVNDVNNVHTLLVMLRYKDPVNGTRTLMLSYFNRKWFVISQGTGIVSICSAILGGHADTFASSGSDVTQILQSQISPLAFKVQTALSDARDPIKVKRFTRIGVAQTVTGVSDLAMTADSEQGSVAVPALPNNYLALTFVNNSGEVLTFENNSNQPLTFTANGFLLTHQGQFSQSGRFIGATATGTLNGDAINGIYIEYAEGPLWGSG